MAWLNNFRIVWKAAIIVAILSMARFLSIGFAAVRMNDFDDGYSNLVNRVDAATVAVARGSRDIESFVSLVYQLETDMSAEAAAVPKCRRPEDVRRALRRGAPVDTGEGRRACWLSSRAQEMFGGCAQVVQAVESADTRTTPRNRSNS
jgi:hypothetical protein